MTNKLRNWLAHKVNGYLTTKEGCTLLVSESSGDLTKIIIQDVFGQSYEIQIKTLAHTLNGQDDYENVFKRPNISFSQNKNII